LPGVQDLTILIVQYDLNGIRPDDVYYNNMSDKPKCDVKRGMVIGSIPGLGDFSTVLQNKD